MSVHIKHHLSDHAVTSTSNPRGMRVISRWWQNTVQNWQRRKMIAALEALNDRTLLDIGVHRGEIRRVVEGFNEAELRMAPVAPEPASHDASYADLRRAA